MTKCRNAQVSILVGALANSLLIFLLLAIACTSAFRS